MAVIYPKKEDLGELPFSELSVYELLAQLGDGFTVFHSVQWVKRGSKWKSTWKENDFLILNRHLGALVLEVKGGEIECHGGVFHQKNSQTGEISYLNPEKKTDPLSQAIDGVYHYRRVLDDISPELSDRFPIEAAVWFSSCNVRNEISKFPLKYREVQGAVLGAEDFEDGLQSIYRVLEFYANKQKVNITDDEYNDIIDTIASDFELITAPSAKRNALDKAFLKMTKEQTYLLDYIEDQYNATIQGVAGTGKTLIAKEAARRFGAEGHKVLFLCFNRFLYLHLKENFPYDNVDYANIHTFIARYRQGADLSDKKARAAELQKIDWDLFEYDDIVIDEAQDFMNDEIIYFKDYSELHAGHFYAFYDKNQLLTTEEVPKWIVDSECKLRLTKNCRNTQQIAQTSYNVIDIDLDKKVIMANGDKTGICFIKGAWMPSMARLLKLLTGEKNDYDYSDIVILTLKSEANSIMSDVTKLSGMPVTRERTDSSILFTTASKFKGLESRVVIITDIDEKCFSNDDRKRLFYVACSRATQKLFLFVTGDDQQIQSIAKAINENSRFSPKGLIAIKTKSQIIDL